MNISNKLLLRQIKKHLGSLDSIPGNLLAFIEAINESYDHYEKDRKMLERSIELSSKEMIELYTQLRNESEESSKQVFEKLKESLVLLNEQDEEIIPKEIDYSKLSQIADILKNETKKRRIAEKVLRDNENKFRTLLENSSDAIIVINEKGEFTYASDSLYRISGFHPEDIIGHSIFPFIHPAARDEAFAYLKGLLDNVNNSRSIVYKFLRKDGSYIWCEGVAKNLIDEPMINGIVFNFRDITDRKTYENALKASNENLKKSNTELDKFVYSVSHDLRAPLSSMLGVVSLMESDATDPSVLGDLNLLKNSINKLDGFILDILDYSRNSRAEVKNEEINFKEILNDVTSHLKYMKAGNPGVKIDISFSDGTVFYSDKSRISIIVNNLISNSIRYSNPDITNPYVEVAITTDPKVAIIVVKDNGIGISKENQPRIFDMFYRASKNSVGSGLGLYILKETVEKLRGKISFRSELGEGTEFKITIPNLFKS